MQPNRLAREASPYLVQHGHNPVDWYPWGEEALARAKAEDRPILLSVGYSACHWCHVMERESFEDEATAAVMNERFVNIKVDREERPDIDQIYQLVVQLMGRNGGWPLTVFLTPDQKPFFGGTYFPPVARYGMPSFTDVLVAVSNAYRDKRADVLEQADELARAIAQVGASASAAEGSVDLGAIERAVAKLVRRFDDVHGGFGARPKFPNTMALDLLLVHGERERVRKALDAMQNGGIHDQLGGGFHRYSTDERWLVPHFEKMLYDNALLLRLYADGHRAFGEQSYAETARGIVGWAFREMSHESGLFFSTQDADSEGHEGKFFVWSVAQVREALAGDETDATLAGYGVTEEGNFEDGPESVLCRKAPVGERARAKLFAAREKRPRPFRDEKIMTSLNALFIGALADAGGALGEPTWVARARRAFEGIWSLLVTEDLHVARYAKEDRVVGTGFLDDYAYLADAALDLYQATGDSLFIERAHALAKTLLLRFRDPEGGFFIQPSDGEVLIHRSKDSFDHAVPAGAAMAARVLLRLGALVDEELHAIGESEVRRLSRSATDNPFAYASTLMNMDELARGRVDVVLTVPSEEMASAVLRAYLPHRLLVRAAPTDGRPSWPLLAGKEAPGAYVCRGTSCSQPVANAEALTALLQGSEKT